MRTFGWAPSEGELQELVGEIDQVEKRAKKIILNKFFGKGWKWLYHLQRVCVANDQVSKTKIGSSHIL